MLILGGLVLLGWGGWLYYQNWLEATKPPPARILEVSVADLETPTPWPTFTAVKPTAAPAEESDESPVLAPTNSPTPEPIATPSLGDTLPEVASPTATVPFETTPEPVEAAAPSQPATATPESAGNAVLSLEDNPLVVSETEAETATEAEPVLDEPAPVAPSPLNRIVAENINLDSPIVEVGWKQVMQNGQLTNVWVVAEYAAGWHENSMLPGQGGNIVLSGHHNIKGEVFRHIVDLEPGAIISLYLDDQRYDYAVADKFIVKDKGEPEAVRRENAKWVGPFNDERLTMVTCWPYNNNTHRVIVIAKPVNAANNGVNTINAVPASGG
jgi:sortase A